MSAFWYSTVLQWKMDLRSKEVLLVYYIVPLVFFAFIGGVFTSINPEAYKALIPTMTVFSVSMGALIGAPAPLSETYGGEVKRAYQVGGIPLWSPVLTHILSGTVHLMLVSLILFLIAPMAFGAEIPGNLPSYFSLLFLFILASLSIGCALGLWVKNPSKLTMFSQFLFLPSIMLSGIMFPAEMLPHGLRELGWFFPATWGYQALCGEESLLLSLLLLLAFLVVSVAIILWRLAGIRREA